MDHRAERDGRGHHQRQPPHRLSGIGGRQPEQDPAGGGDDADLRHEPDQVEERPVRGAEPDELRDEVEPPSEQRRQ
ncbi:hypothetical protein CXG46_04965 [Nocardioides alpinus]|uniref:Uncharacterized protein n=1 Tax=Nocardioides alpinus TaxID=748909 RepID=A0ABX4R1C3_9ACTN|nr:hypothetical protein CXG46_04965 [Nocardioides alpinus]